MGSFRLAEKEHFSEEGMPGLDGDNDMETVDWRFGKQVFERSANVKATCWN